MGFWEKRRVLITGGKGFLGSYVTKQLKAKGCKDIFIPKEESYNLVDKAAVKKVYRDSRPDIVIHLAAKVGGIGLNKEKPGA